MNIAQKFEYLATTKMNHKALLNRLTLLLILFFEVLQAQINPKDVEIIRDSYGVPHIYGKTD
ncbi:MAG: hypothetical protein VYA01_04060, partial [Bacteroidota bacterium]|nr:hypothetical protein [Bacteroidota bacterium]